MSRSGRASAWGTGPALLAAGLLFFTVSSRADAGDDGAGAAPPAHASPAPAVPGPVPTPPWASSLAAQGSRTAALGGRLTSLELEVRHLRLLSSGLKAALGSQEAALSRTVQALDQASAALAAQAKAQAGLDAGLAGVDARADALERRLGSVDEDQAAAGVQAAAERERRRELGRRVDALQSGLDAARAAAASQDRQVKALLADQDRLDDMQQLLDLVQRDVQANDEELVEAKQAIRRLEAPPDQGSGWWHAFSTYKYLPVVATGLAVVALGIEAGRR